MTSSSWVQLHDLQLPRFKTTSTTSALQNNISQLLMMPRDSLPSLCTHNAFVLDAALMAIGKPHPPPNLSLFKQALTTSLEPLDPSGETSSM